MPSPSTTSIKKTVSGTLLEWYAVNARDLPWRNNPDPYQVWLSEIMLQQTTVKAVIPYYKAFVARWPSVEALAAAKLDDILTEWAGLGYYARARNLKTCADVVAGELGGEFPDTLEGLMALPGIGEYTAAAIATIAHGMAATVVDGNIERVIARLYRVEAPLPGAKGELRKLAQALTPAEQAGDYAQAMMDLGATICTPKSPKCAACPLDNICAVAGQNGEGGAADYPRRTPKKPRPKKQAFIYWLVNGDKVLMQRRAEAGLLGGMMEFPSSPWSIELAENDHPHAPVKAEWVECAERVHHVFTHFELTLTVWVAKHDGAGPGGKWIAIGDLQNHALPSLMRKVTRVAAR